MIIHTVLNTLKIKCSYNDFEKLLQEIKGNNRNEFIDFNAIIPMPQELEYGDTLESVRKPFLHDSDVVYWYLKMIDNKEMTSKIDIADLDCIKSHIQFDNGPLEFLIFETFEEFLEFSNLTKEKIIEFSEKYIYLFCKYGYTNPYSWRIDNWGTKRNAQNSKITKEDKTIWFETAWDGVPQIMEKLVQKYPNFEFEYSYEYDDKLIEYYGKNGILTMRNL